MKRLAALALLVIAGACSASSSGQPLPTGSDKFPGEMDGVMTAATNPPTTVAVAAPATSCDVVREALLTGTPAEIKASMQQLKADKTADATAREYADKYLAEETRDYSWAKDNAESLKKSSVRSIVAILRMYCS